LQLIKRVYVHVSACSTLKGKISGILAVLDAVNCFWRVMCRLVIPFLSFSRDMCTGEGRSCISTLHQAAVAFWFAAICCGYAAQLSINSFDTLAALDAARNSA
jgi:hypothetical protein